MAAKVAAVATATVDVGVGGEGVVTEDETEAPGVCVGRVACAAEMEAVTEEAG